MAYLPRIDDPTIFCDSTVFSDSFDSSSIVLPSSMSDESSPPAPKKPSTGSKDNIPSRIFPVLPTSHNFSALGNPDVFESYIKSQLPLALDDEIDSNILHLSLKSSASQSMGPTERQRRLQESKFLNKLLSTGEHRTTTTLNWVERTMFPDSKLPVPFKYDLVTQDPTIWNEKSLALSRHPADMKDAQVRTWLNNLSDNLSVAHEISLQLSGRSDRAFDSQSSTKVLDGSYQDRKPDICVIDRKELHDEDVTPTERLH